MDHTHNSTLVAHMKLKTRVESNRLTRQQSFGMFNNFKDLIAFELFLWRKKEEERRKKEERR